MDNVLGYEGKTVVVTGAASGMGEAAAKILVDVGANVIALDVKPTELAGVTSMIIDLRDKASIDDVVSKIDGPVQAVFSVAGLPGPPFSDLDTMTVNFVGARHLVESLVPKMAPGGGIVCVASNGGLGWQQNLEAIMPLVNTPDFESGQAWVEANAETIALASAYAFSKQCTNAYVASRGTDLIAQGIRLNCTNPGPTTTAMMPYFEEQNGKDLIDAFIGPSGRRSLPEEQAWPMVFLNSPHMTYVAGEAIHVDGGFLGAMVTGKLQVSFEVPES